MATSFINTRTRTAGYRSESNMAASGSQVHLFKPTSVIFSWNDVIWHQRECLDTYPLYFALHVWSNIRACVVSNRRRENSDQWRRALCVKGGLKISHAFQFCQWLKKKWPHPLEGGGFKKNIACDLKKIKWYDQLMNEV